MDRNTWIENYLKGKVCEVEDIKEFFRLEGVERIETKCPYCKKTFISSKSMTKCKSISEDSYSLKFHINDYKYKIEFIPTENKDEVKITNIIIGKI